MTVWLHSHLIDNSILNLSDAERADQGEMRVRAGYYSAILKEKWAAMTHEEKLEYVKVDMERLEKRCDSSKYTPHNVSINCFHNCRGTLEKVEREVCIMLPFLSVIVLTS